LLRRLYLELGDGGFGPGYGLLRLSDDRHGALGMYRHARSNPSSNWSAFPSSLLPVSTWGCAIFSFIDCSSPDGQMWGWDPNPGPVGAQALYPQSLDIAGWLGRWVEHTLYQPCLVEDADTGTWRGATDADYARFLAELD
jgi:hypothetical protein